MMTVRQGIFFRLLDSAQAIASITSIPRTETSRTRASLFRLPKLRHLNGLDPREATG